MVTLMTPDVNVILLDLGDTRNREMVTENEDGSYTIFINARLSHNLQLKEYDHAMIHINDQHFEQHDVQTIEHCAHQAKEQGIEPIPADKYRERVEQELKRIRARRQKRKQEMTDYSQYVSMMERSGVDFFAVAENQFLYGSDL